ncbi:otolith matrix protein OMM-64-like isoform X1 [Cyprinus carpio]|uniref:Otolith matrix protein OMM-64-like isoform X1 n=2 Tax=Cyprinus carpio TaxID=7962 RepID=A0A9Q9YDI8_CYPCA|nr:otolith matrix protein OMM-64-like isoform X1 [Cyprinus carpio]
MEQNIADFLLDAFPAETNFENLNFDDDTATAHGVNAPQNEPGMEEDNSHRESSGSDSDVDLEWTNREEETKHCFENNRNFSLDEQSMKAGSTLCGSWDDNDPVENKTQTRNQQLSLHEDDCRENAFEIHEDIHEDEDVSVLEMVLPKGTHYGLETTSTRTQEETTSHLLSYQMVDKTENESSASKEERMEPDSTEEHVLQHSPDDKQLNHFSAIQSTWQDWKVESVEVQSGDEMNEFTEEDLEDDERDEEGLAEYSSDLSQSDSGDSSEGHEGGQPNHTDSNLVEEQAVGLGCSYETKNLEEPLLTYSVVTSREDDDVQKKGECLDPADMFTYVKNEDLYVEATTGKSDDGILFQTKQGSFRDAGYHREISNIGESSDFGFSKNFQSNSSECYMSEQPDYDIPKKRYLNPEDIPEFISHTVSEDKNTPLQKQEHTFAMDFASDWHSIEHEVVDGVVKDSQKPEMCGVEGLSSIPASHGTVMKCSTEIDLSENISDGESHPSESVSVKTDQNNQEHKSEHSEVSDIGENINTFLPEMFWSQDNLKLDEYEWDINEEEVICDEEENFLEELENDGEETERDWEKEKARIEAFNRYYEPVEGEENKARSHKVKFCLEPESSQYEEDSYSSEEELSTKRCISELHPPESSSVKQDQSNEEDSREPSEVSDIRENISTFLMDEDNMKLDDYDRDINEEEEFFKINSSKVICDGDDDVDFLEKLKIEIERDMEQEQARIEACNRYHGESFKEEQNEAVTDGTHKVMLRFHQQPSQNEEDNDSSEQESNTEDDTASILKTEDQSDSDEPTERRLYTARYKVLPKGLQKADKNLKEQPKRNKCLVLLQSVLAVSLATAVGVLSYWWATDTLDWLLNSHGSWIFNMIQNPK